MTHLFVNALAASAGGGITYIRNVLPHLARRSEIRTTCVLTRALRAELPALPQIGFVECAVSASTGGRFLYEQRVLPELIRRHGATILLSAGNFALWRSPVPQILLSRNSIYVSEDYNRDLRKRGDYRRWIDTKIKGKLAAASIRRAELTAAPSEAFAADLRRWLGPKFASKIVAIHHGFDLPAFESSTACPAELAAQIENPRHAVRLLFVSHYNYYRNFETLLKGLPLIRKELAPRPVELVLTCKLDDASNPGSYWGREAAALRDQLEVQSSVIELGAVPYTHLHHVYRTCDIYVSPAYTETFAHPLVEAMASGLPVVASDLAVHREICGRAANYFPRFSEAALAAEVICLAKDGKQRAGMSQAGLARSRDFSWERHVASLLEVAADLEQSGSGDVKA